MDKFTKVRNIGKGNMGACALARNNEDGKYYVIKQVDLTRMSKKERQQSLNEARVLSSLRHPNIINYVDSFLARKSDNLCIVMEFADGGDLSSRIKKCYGVNFREAQVLDWFIQLVLSLHYVHQRKILHRDVKTQNIFLTSDNVVKLGDFGIARALNNTYDQAKTFVGTPYYLSPELILERPYDHRSDVWALGVVLYEVLALKHPFNAMDMKGLMQRILKVQYDPIPPMYSTEMRNMVPRLLMKEPSNRIRLEEILELPLVHRRLLEWIRVPGTVPAKYLDALISQKLLPASVLELVEAPHGSRPSPADSPGALSAVRSLASVDHHTNPPPPPPPPATSSTPPSLVKLPNSSLADPDPAPRPTTNAHVVDRVSGGREGSPSGSPRQTPPCPSFSRPLPANSVGPKLVPLSLRSPQGGSPVTTSLARRAPATTASHSTASPMSSRRSQQQQVPPARVANLDHLYQQLNRYNQQQPHGSRTTAAASGVSASNLHRRVPNPPPPTISTRDVGVGREKVPSSVAVVNSRRYSRGSRSPSLQSAALVNPLFRYSKTPQPVAAAPVPTTVVPKAAGGAGKVVDIKALLQRAAAEREQRRYAGFT